MKLKLFNQACDGFFIPWKLYFSFEHIWMEVMKIYIINIKFLKTSEFMHNAIIIGVPLLWIHHYNNKQRQDSPRSQPLQSLHSACVDEPPVLLHLHER